jgi:hypothetical protein
MVHNLSPRCRRPSRRSRSSSASGPTCGLHRWAQRRRSERSGTAADAARSACATALASRCGFDSGETVQACRSPARPGSRRSWCNPCGPIDIRGNAALHPGTAVMAFLKQFPDDGACWRYLEKARRPQGPVCLKCGNVGPTKACGRKHYPWRRRKGHSAVCIRRQSMVAQTRRPASCRWTTRLAARHCQTGTGRLPARNARRPAYRPRVVFDHGGDTVAEKPCRLLSDAEMPSQREAGKPLAGDSKQIERREPRPHREERAFQRRPEGDGELGIAALHSAVQHSRALEGPR